MRLPGKKVLMVVAPEQFRDEELFVPRRLLEEAGAQVTVASTRSGQVRGMLGGNVAARAAIDMVRADEYDAVLVVGGDGAQVSLWPHAGLHSVLRQARDRDAVIGAICLAPVALARAGLVGGETAVARSPASLHELESRGVRVAAQDVLVSGRIITASGPQVAEQWAQAVIAALAGNKEHRNAPENLRGIQR